MRSGDALTNYTEGNLALRGGNPFLGVLEPLWLKETPHRQGRRGARRKEGARSRIASPLASLRALRGEFVLPIGGRRDAKYKIWPHAFGRYFLIEKLDFQT